MAKMTSTGAKTLAKAQALQNATVRSYTVEQLEALDWSGRQTQAREYAKAAAAELDEAARLNFGDVFINAYSETVGATWSVMLRDRENARRSFKRACDGITHEEAIAMIRSLVTSMNIRGARVDDRGIEVVRGGDYSGPRLYWNFSMSDYDGLANPDNDAQRVRTYEFEVKVSTSGTSYTPAEMAVVHRIHGELLDAANELVATMARVRVISKRGFEGVL